MAKTYEQRINNITGQLGGIKRMIEEDKDSFQVLTQMKAARSAVNSLMSSYIEENFWEFVKSCENQEEACRKFFDELVRAN